MTYRLGEYECTACGRKVLASSIQDDDKLPVHRHNEPAPAYRPGSGSGYVDSGISRGTRRH